MLFPRFPHGYVSSNEEEQFVIALQCVPTNFKSASGVFGSQNSPKTT